MQFLARNVERDREHQTALLAAGWRVGVIWECALRPKDHVEEVALRVERWLRSGGEELVAGREWPGQRRDG